MATTDQAIQILTTLEYLDTYNKVPYFGLVLQTGLGAKVSGGTLDLTTADIENMLKPWMWWDPAKAIKPASVNPPKIQLWQATPNSSAPKLITTDILAVPNDANGKPFSVDSSIIDQLNEDCGDALPD